VTQSTPTSKKENMNIEPGDYFVVARGFKYGDSSSMFVFSALFGGCGETPKEKEDQYDRSHEGRVYRAEEVCGPAIAARCVHGNIFGGVKPGDVLSLNTNDVEVWPVTKKYVDALGIQLEVKSS
jgi:hypothetical protein